MSRLAVARRAVAGLAAAVMGVATGLPPFATSNPVSAANPPLEGVIDVEAGGAFACAIVNEDATATTGSVWCWGDNSRGQLGVNDGALANSQIAREVSTSESGFTNQAVEILALGKEHACAVENGDLYCWGSNSRGKAGTDSVGTSSSSEVVAPVRVAKPTDVTEWTSLALGDEHTCALTNKDVGGSPINGVIYCWGHGDYLGNGNLSSISGDSEFTQRNPQFPANGIYWNDATDGVRNQESNTSPTPIADVDVSATGTNKWNYTYTGAGSIFHSVSNSGYSLISAGTSHTCAAKTTGAEEGVYCWGANASGQSFINNALPLIWQPSKFTGDASFSGPKTWIGTGIKELVSKDAGNCVVKDEGALSNAVFCWSQSIFGGASNWGAGFIDSSTVIENVSELSLASNSMWDDRFACGIKDAAITCFGRNNTAQVSQLEAGEMGSNDAVTDLSLRGFSRNLGCAVKSGGAYCWVLGYQPGGNSSGQLGNDTTTESATPVQVLRTPPPPGAPTDLVAAPGDQKITIEFTAGATNGWAVTTYQYSLDGGTTWSYLVRPGLTSPIEILVDHSNQPLTNGQTYTVILRFANGTAFSGPTITGDASASVSATPAAPTAPGSPTGVTATAGDGSATVSWTAPTSNGGNDIIRYRANVVGNGSLSCTAEPPATSCDVTGLTNGTAYTFEVTATNVNGTSAASTASDPVTPVAAASGADGDADSGTGTDSGTNTSTGTDSGTSSETATDSGTDGAADDAAGEEPITTPETATTSEAVTDDDATELASEPGDGKVIVDGTPVTPTVSRLSAEGTDTPPAERTPEQVEAIQQAAQELVDGFNDIAGEDSPIEVTDTETGAVITGLLTNPDDPDTPVEVPVERVLVMTAGDLAIMAVATDDAGDTLPLDDGSLQMSSNGNVAMAVAGLPTSTAGEIVLLPSRTVLGTFTTTADGMLTGEITIPADLAAGDYGIAIAVGTSRMSLGVKATASPAELPATGGGTDLAAVAMVMLGVGLLLAGRRRRQLS